MESAENKRVPRGVRNNNPLNIRKSKDRFLGEIIPSRDKEFKEFETVYHGYRAAFIILKNYIKKGYNTIEKIISRWAPSEDGNDTIRYINSVSRSLDQSPTELIREEKNWYTLQLLVYAMACMEIGTENVNVKDIIMTCKRLSTIQTSM